MKTDAEGFSYPEICKATCVNCGRCDNICAFAMGWHKPGNFSVPLVYSLTAQDDAVLKSSASGGAGQLLAGIIIDKGGIVYGVAYDESFHVVHRRAQSDMEAQSFRMSKYVQSDLTDIFRQVKDDLSEHPTRPCLFIGTACQCAGLQRYLISCDTDITALYTCDVLCHGVPSPGIYREYLEAVEKKYGSRIREVRFRSKQNGWINARSGTCIIMENGKSDDLSGFFNLYFKHLILRPSCTVCPYTRIDKPSDITIADFWGIDKLEPSSYDVNGVSLVVVHSEKGKLLQLALSESSRYREFSTDCLTARQFHQSAQSSAQRDAFWTMYRQFGLRKAVKAFCPRQTFWRRALSKLKRLIVK